MSHLILVLLLLNSNKQMLYEPDGWEIFWVTCFYLYSPNIRIQKDKFSQQCFQEICQTLVCIYIYIYIYIYLVIHNGLKVLVYQSVSSFPIIIYHNGAPYPAFLKSFRSIIISQDNMHPYYIIKLWSHYFAPCLFYSFLLFDTLVNNLHHSKDLLLVKWL